VPLDDHVLILQAERAIEALSDEVEALGDTDAFADIDHSHDEYAFESRVDDVEHDLDKLEDDFNRDVPELRANLREAVDILTDLVERVDSLEARHIDLVRTLRGRGIPA
jgi:DNA repair exonuclease SbcCD ATPase subunit